KVGADFGYEPQHVLSYAMVVGTPQGAARIGDKVDLIGAADRTDATLSNAGAYAQLTWEAIPDLKVTANVRADVPNLFPAQPSWRLAIARRWSDALTTRLVGGEAF